MAATRVPMGAAGWARNCFGLLALAVIKAAWALGPAAPPLVELPIAFVDNDAATGPRLVVNLTVEVPGGDVPRNVQSVTVRVPGGAQYTVPHLRGDLGYERDYQLDLTAAGVIGFPAGTYTFTVTDTAGGVTSASDDLAAAVPLDGPSSIAISGLLPPPPANDDVGRLDPGTTPTPTVSWPAVPGAAIYRLRVRGGFGDLDLFSRTTGTTSITLPAGTLVPSRRYVVRVEAYDDARRFPFANTKGRRDVELVTEGPEIFLLFGENYFTGQTLNAMVRAYHTGHSPVTANAQAWVGLPDGTTMPILDLPNLVIPGSTAGNYFLGTFYRYTFTGAEPNGVYIVGLRLTDPITGGTIALATRTFMKQ